MEKQAYVAANATIVGDVTLENNANIWYGAVLRGDAGPIIIGEGSNVQDLCVIHEKTTIGKNVTIGHGAIVHGCTVGDNSTIGMGAIVLTGAKIGRCCMIGAGALVTGKADIPDGSMVLGSPAKVIRPMKEAEIQAMADNAAHYILNGQQNLPKF